MGSDHGARGAVYPAYVWLRTSPKLGNRATKRERVSRNERRERDPL